MTLNELGIWLSSLPLRIGHEKLAQADLEAHLVQKQLTFTREASLSREDHPDFIVQTTEGQAVVELKIRAQRKRIFKQLERYAKHECVAGVFLFTATPMGLPVTIEGKPAYSISMGQGWL